MPEQRSTPKTELVDDIIARYIKECEVGEPPDQEEILNRYPEFESELRAFFEDRQHLMALLPHPDHPPCLGEDYEILELIDDGGQGIVYKAHQKSLNKTVAIKVPRQSAVRFDPEGIRKEAQRAARLRHPNIVPMHHVGEHEGQRFCVMEYIEGQSLARLTEKGPLAPADAARYAQTIAEAIHYAHQRELLHCDLKPGNILTDDDGKPYVTDFGLAKRLGEGGRYRPYSFVGGTASYMAPEQARGDELTTATDVYGLGAILYALLTGAAPFRGDTVEHTLQLVQEVPPVAPGERNSDVDPDLDAICLKCLRKNPEERYASADALVRDLERYQKQEQTTARTWSRSERVAGWYRRKPALAGSVTAAVIISMLTVVIALSIAHARRQAQMEEALRSNTSVARALAKTALLQLRDWGRIVEVAAGNPELPKLLQRDDRKGLQRYVELVCRSAPEVCASCGVRNLQGVSVARIGEGQPDFSTGTSSQRDYFQGALTHLEFGARQSVHISKVYVSTVDRLHKFALSAPIRDRNGQPTGVILLSVTTDAVLGLVNFEDSHRKVALIAPRDSWDADLGLMNGAPGHLILFHPAYRRGGPAIEFPAESSIARYGEPVHNTELDDSNVAVPASADYEDPVSTAFPEYRGRWIAAFAPVGNTGFFLVVQQRVEDALNVDPFVSWNVAVGIAIVMTFIIAIAVALLRRRH